MFTAQDCTRNLRWFLFFRLSFDFALWAPIWVLYMDEVLGLSFTELMVLEMLFQFAIAAFEIPTGMLADTLGRRWSLRAAAVTMSLTLLIWGLATNVWWALLSWIGWSLAATLFNGADCALIFESLHAAGKGHRFSVILGRITSIAMLSAVAASVVGGWLIESVVEGGIREVVINLVTPADGFGIQDILVAQGVDTILKEWGYRLVILLHSVLLIFSVFSAFRMKEPPRVEEAVTGKPREILSSIWALLKSSDRLRVFLLFSAFVDLAFVVVTLYQQHLLVDAGMSMKALGWYFAIGTLIGAAGPLLLTWAGSRWGVARLMVIISVSVTLSTAAVFFAPGLWVVFPFIAVRFVATGARPLVIEGMNAIVGSRGRATALSLRGIVTAVLMGPMGVLTGLWADRYPIRKLFLIIGGILPVVFAGLAALWRRNHTLQPDSADTSAGSSRREEKDLTHHDE